MGRGEMGQRLGAVKGGTPCGRGRTGAGHVSGAMLGSSGSNLVVLQPPPPTHTHTRAK